MLLNGPMVLFRDVLPPWALWNGFLLDQITYRAVAVSRRWYILTGIGT
jgi:hypothetical protein